MKTILACVDFSDTSDAVVEAAVQLAGAFSSRLLLLHVASPEPDFVPLDVGPQAERDAAARLLREEHRRLQALEKRLKQDGLDAVALVVQGPVATKIVQESKVMNADVVVMGSHGHGAVYELLVGSVTEAVLRKTRTPVLVVPRPR